MPKRLPEPLCIGCNRFVRSKLNAYLRAVNLLSFRGVGDGESASVKKSASFHPIFLLPG